MSECAGVHELSAIASRAASHQTVLVADDDSPTRVLIRAALEPDGWKVEEAEDGLEACDSVERVQPDIVLLDVNMPGLGGIEACERLRASRAGRHVPVLMITVQDDPDAIRRAYDAGATDFLPKPFDFTILRQRLQYMHRAEQDSRALRHERDFVSAVVDRSAALVLILDPTGRIVRFNERCSRAAGLSASEVTGKRVWDVLSSPDDRDAEREAFESLVADRGTAHYEGVWTRPDGGQREIAWFNSVLETSEGEVEHVVCTGLDITERNQAQEKLRFLSSYDPLTGLPNRRLVNERLEEAIAAAADGEQIGVLALDLDRFKDLNTTWGRAVGDQLLCEMADRLAKSLRLSDVFRGHDRSHRADLGRVGSDEFSVLVPRVDDADDLAMVAKTLQQALTRPLRIESGDLALTASVGAALYPADGNDSETLLRNAESAVDVARQKARGSCHFYSVAMHSDIEERVTLEAELRQAVVRHELQLYYQPKMSTETGRIVGAEALIRWQHPSRGLLTPGAFIAVAEETGLIAPIGKWVIRRACDQVMNWLESDRDAVPVAVNLSSAQFQLADVLENIVWTLNETALDPTYLSVEVTESMIMENAEQAREVLCRLKTLGVQTAIDDFGTGYSTLGMLKTLPVRHLKIDQAFIRDLPASAEDLAITRAIIGMAHGLGLTVIAEGVESEEQLELLRKEGCDEVQGYLIGRPVPADQFATLLDRQRRPRAARPEPAKPRVGAT